ncbi:MAG: hypothetical protein AAGD10_10020 [Myxococcota bacterium]
MDESPRPGARRQPCTRTLVADSPVVRVEVSDCGIREVLVGGLTIKFEAHAFEEFVNTLQQASGYLLNSGAGERMKLALVPDSTAH